MAIVHLAESKRHKNGVGRVLCWKNMPVPWILRDMYVNVCIQIYIYIYINRYMGNKKPRNLQNGARKSFLRAAPFKWKAVQQLPNYHRFGRHLCDMPQEVGSFNPVGCPENAGFGESS